MSFITCHTFSMENIKYILNRLFFLDDKRASILLLLHAHKCRKKSCSWTTVLDVQRCCNFNILHNSARTPMHALRNLELAHTVKINNKRYFQLSQKGVYVANLILHLIGPLEISVKYFGDLVNCDRLFLYRFYKGKMILK